jgi:very-short-patch-repair endonuclease
LERGRAIKSPRQLGWVRQDYLESLGLRVMRFASDEVQAGINRMIRRIEDAVAG